jgi:hypothetical protein
MLPEEWSPKHITPRTSVPGASRFMGRGPGSLSLRLAAIVHASKDVFLPPSLIRHSQLIN